MTSHCSLGSEQGKVSYSEKVKEYGATLHPGQIWEMTGNQRSPSSDCVHRRDSHCHPEALYVFVKIDAVYLVEHRPAVTIHFSGEVKTESLAPSRYFFPTC